MFATENSLWDKLGDGIFGAYIKYKIICFLFALVLGCAILIYEKFGWLGLAFAAVVFILFIWLIVKTGDWNGDKARQSAKRKEKLKIKDLEALFSLTYNGMMIVKCKNKQISRPVVIPDVIDGIPVVAIGADAFSGCAKLPAIEIPSGTLTIGIGAFANCDSLVSVDLPESVDTIAEKAFYSCDALSELNIPPSLVKLGDDAFAGCRSLKIAVLPPTLRSFGRRVFEKTTKLLVFPNSMAEAWARETSANYERIM